MPQRIVAVIWSILLESVLLELASGQKSGLRFRQSREETRRVASLGFSSGSRQQKKTNRSSPTRTIYGVLANFAWFGGFLHVHLVDPRAMAGLHLLNNKEVRLGSFTFRTVALCAVLSYFLHEISAVGGWFGRWRVGPFVLVSTLLLYGIKSLIRFLIFH